MICRNILIIGSILLSLFICSKNTQAQQVIAESDPSITTDTLKSRGMVVGVNSNGGGVINYVSIPGIGNIFGPQSVKYGRSGQSAMRDAMHGGKYNPTQAGFNETLGTPCEVLNENEKLTVPARPVALWYGDCQWDFTEWENIGADPSCYPDGGNSDVDELDESNLAGKQNTEVKSEFDYYGFYHDYNAKGGIEIACMRHYFEYRYAREPGHCISQFRPGLDIFKSDQIHPDISTKFPAGNHTAEPNDMSNFILSWHLRNDVVNWDPKYQYYIDNSGKLVGKNREVYVKETLDENGNVIVPRLIIISDSNDPDADNALGFYMPNSEFNIYETIGVDETSDKIVYKDKRIKSIRIWDQPRRISSMAVYGFKTESNGLLNRNRLPENIYEAYRFDMYMLMGSPNNIWETVNKIENNKVSWSFNSSNDNWIFTGAVTQHGDSSISLTIEEEQTEFTSPDSLLVDADLQRFVTIRLKNNSSANGLSLKFKRYDNDEIFTHNLQIQANTSDWKTYSIDATTISDWSGMIQQLGFGIDATSGTIEIDFIKITADDIVDCNGDFGGAAYIDACGQCVGGNAGERSCEDCMGVENGQAVLNACGDCIGGTSPTIVTKEWHFDDLNDWSLNSRISGYTSGGIARLTINGNDPFMNFGGVVCIDTEKDNFIQVRMKNNTNGTSATIYYENDLVSGVKPKSFNVSQNDQEYKTYIVDMSKEANWKGNIKRIRFDPPGSSGLLELDYIKVNDGNPTGINDINLQVINHNMGIEVYPNPSKNYFHVQTENESVIHVYDSRGVLVHITDQSDVKHLVKTNDWNSGLYLIKAINSKGIKFAKCLILD